MLGLSLSTVALFCGFTVLIFYVQKHGTVFQGSSAGFGAALTIVGLAGLVAQLAFYVAVWYLHGFLATLALFGVSLLCALLFTFAEIFLRIPFLLISTFSLVAAPILGALAWWLLLS